MIFTDKNQFLPEKNPILFQPVTGKLQILQVTSGATCK